jgi:hypothetical protein
LTFSLNSLHFEKLTQKISLFLELYTNSIEINKNLYYSHFWKKKNKNCRSGRFFSSPLARPGYARPTRALVPAPALSLAPSRAAQHRAWPSKRPSRLALSPALTDMAAPPVIPFLPLSLFSRAQPCPHGGRPATTAPVTRRCLANVTNMTYVTPRTPSDI